MTKSLHATIYFIADKPTKKNARKDIPLVGTTSYKTLLNWIADMSIDITNVKIYNQADDPFGFLEKYSQAIVDNHFEDYEDIKVIALGNNAEKYLKKRRVREFYKLPHPSGLNRKLNDKKKLRKLLNQCKNYIYKKEN